MGQVQRTTNAGVTMQVTDVFSYEAACTDLLNAYESSKDGVEITIKENKTTRSTLQNSFYWANVQDISKFMIGAGAYYELQGVKLEYTRETVHGINKAMFSIDSTTKLDIKEFITYMDSVMAFWSQRTHGNWQPKELARNHMKGIE